MVDPHHPGDGCDPCHEKRSGVQDLHAPASSCQHDRCHRHDRSQVPQILVKERSEADLERRPQPVEVGNAPTYAVSGPSPEAAGGEPDPPWQHEHDSDEPRREEAWPQPAPLRERR